MTLIIIQMKIMALSENYIIEWMGECDFRASLLIFSFLSFHFRQLPVPYSKAGINGGTAIPLPATVLVTRRCPPDKVRPLPPTPNQQSCEL